MTRRSAALAVLLWAGVAHANHDGLAEGIALALAAVAVGSIAALWLLITTLSAVLKKDARRCKRLSALSFVAAVGCAAGFVAARPSADASKLLVPSVVFAAAGVAALRVAKRA